jgi:hypothetical protein
MADNVDYTPGSGATIAADEIAGILYQRIKPAIGEDGVAIDVSQSNPMPSVAQRTDDLVELLQRLVKVCETLQVVDSAQRQRVTLDAITGALTLAAVTTVSTVTTVSSVSNVAAQTQMAGMDREMYINIAKQTYALSIRPNLTFQ